MYFLPYLENSTVGTAEPAPAGAPAAAAAVATALGGDSEARYASKIKSLAQ